MQLPADLCNRALDDLGSGLTIGAFTDGTSESEACRRIYGPTLRQLLRSANWAFARKLAPLQLLGDSSGQTLDPLGNAISAAVEIPWIYAYAWPIDGVRARWLAQTLTPATTTVPLMTGLGTAQNFTTLPPARFLISSSDQFPTVIGETDWDSLPDLSSTEGVGAIGRRVVLTNVPNANLVYTKLALVIEEWDELFTQGMVSTLASRLAMVVIKDKKLAMAERAQQVALAQAAVREARTVNANDSGFPQNITRIPDFIRVRMGGDLWSTSWPLSANTAGNLYYGWESSGWADGSVY